MKTSNTSLPRLVILGKPNVGKSSMFNVLCNKKLAIVDDTPGVTRDAKIFQIKLYDYDFELVDTAGVESLDALHSNAKPLQNEVSTIKIKQKNTSTNDSCLSQNAFILEQMVRQTLTIAKTADIALLMVDAKAGLSFLDNDIARLLNSILQKTRLQEIILVANKAESRTSIDNKMLYQMGLGDPILVSTAHRIGIEDVCDAVIEAWKRIERNREENGLSNANMTNHHSFIESHSIPSGNSIKRLELVTRSNKLVETSDFNNHATHGITPSRKLGERVSKQTTIAIIGRPNVGKSTLFNKIFGEYHAIVSDVPGTTRDCLSREIEGSNTEEPYLFVDTAGMRKRSKVLNPIEFFSVGQSIAAVRRADIVLLMIDGELGLTSQDETIIRMILNEGKGFVILVNKIDKAPNIHILEEKILKDLEALEIYAPPVVFLSAMFSHDIQPLMDAIDIVKRSHSLLLTTSVLNRWLRKFAAATSNPIASHNKKIIRLKYIAQTAVRPPTFTLFVNHDLPSAYIRFFKKALIAKFDLRGASVRIQIKKSDNPYATKSNKKRT